MASIDAISALIEGNAKWEDYRSNWSGMIDLRLAELRGVNLARRDLSFCDFSGADLENANFDNCSIHDSFFNNAFMEGASLVLCTIESSVFDDANMEGVVIRKTLLDKVYFNKTRLKESLFHSSSLSNCIFDGVNLQSAELEHVKLLGCRLVGIDSPDVSITQSEFTDSTISNSAFSKSAIKSLYAKECSLTNVKLLSSIVDNTTLLRSAITRVDLENTLVSHMDLSGCVLTEVTLSQFDLPNTVLLDVATNNCIWPTQKGEITLWGKYKPSRDLLGQPVQDLKGLPPSLRRDIADAQYLREKSNTSRGISKLFLGVWGATTGYGQSLLRLTTISFLLILLMALAFVASDGSISIQPSGIRNGFNAMGYIFSSFIGFGVDANMLLSSKQEAALLVARISGFFVLGLWLGLAANKVGKLSSE